MKAITIETVKQNGWLLFEGISGSRAYGLDTPASDTDIKGVFILPRDLFYGLEYLPQVSNESNDIVYYELKRFIELLGKNNPNILELLALPDDCILYKHPIMERIKPEVFLSKLCEDSFANYAYSQIKKACGLEKKMSNPVEPERKTVPDFCYVYADNNNIPLRQFLENRNWKQEEIGLTRVLHMRDCYQVFHSVAGNYNGVIKKENANDVALSHVEKEAVPVGLLYFNKDGYSVYCKKYKEYWEWVEKRNNARYMLNRQHGKNYDAKNMMHVFRLLLMAKEIALDGRINVRRSDRDHLLSIKAGKYEYDEILAAANVLKEELGPLFARSPLQEKPDAEFVNTLLVEMRTVLYQKR